MDAMSNDQSSAPDATTAPSATDDSRITIKKYANRRLYNTATSSYVTLDHLSKMVKDGKDFAVFDAKTGEDITRQVLTHIIVEEESKGQNLLPISFLRKLISLYGDNLQWMVPRYLEQSMQSFSRNQEQLRSTLQQTMSGMFPFATLEEMSRQNMAIFDKAIKMFTPFAKTGTDSNGAQDPDTAPPASASSGEGSADLEALKRKLEDFKTELGNLNPNKRS